MTMKNRFRSLAATSAALVAVPVLATAIAACGEDGVPGVPSADEICCTEFSVGADLSDVKFSADAKLNGRFRAFAQSAGDFAAVGTVALDEVLVACRNIAKDLGASDEEVAGSGAAGVNKACAMAVAKINGTFGAGGMLEGSLAIDFQPPKCSVSAEAKLNCEASCDASASCDFNAKPPTCEGGKLEVECSGSCEAEASASVKCEGKCMASCEGACTAQGGVECAGKCEGTCKGAAEGGTGTGIKADGTCDGTCEGTCEVTAPGVTCEGTCKGECTGSCQAEGSVKAKCDGKCTGDISAPKCEGGELKLDCSASAECSGSCNGSAQAKAECTPPSLAIKFQAAAGVTLNAEAEAQLAVAIESIKVNLPKLLVVLQARGQAFVDLGAELAGEADVTAELAGDAGVKGIACGLAVVGVAVEGAANFKSAFEASGKVAGALKIGG